MLLSGGVDSTVCAALMKRALNTDQIIAIHIDNGFMRKRESECVRDSLAKIGLQVKGRNFFWLILEGTNVTGIIFQYHLICSIFELEYSNFERPNVKKLYYIKSKYRR